MVKCRLISTASQLTYTNSWRCKQAIPFSQALRLHRICSEEHQFKQQTTGLKQYLIRRSYNPTQVQLSIDRAAAVPRESALQFSEKRTNHMVSLVTTYDPRLPHLSEITKNHHPVLLMSDRLKGAILEAPITASFETVSVGSISSGW